jgi:spore coat protein U-like protein
MKRSTAWLAALVVAAGTPAGVWAATTTSTFQVSITIAQACQISAVTNMSFGTQGVLSANVDSTSGFSVQCTLTTPYNIGLDAGTGVGATVAVRKMTGPGGATVDYSLFRDAAHLLVWGNTIGVDTVPGVGTGLAIPYTVFGRVPPQATPGPGLYTDTITITVTF